MKKKTLISVFVFFFMLTINAKESEPMYVYGVDFTSVKAYGTDETANQFKDAFERINLLLESEVQKYDFTDIVGGNYELKLGTIIELTQKCDFSDIKTNKKDIEPINVEEKIKSYSIQEKTGIGFIMIATLLDKTTNKATYDVVLFDIESREIIKVKNFTGKAGGFGLRNFWAKSVYGLTKKFKFNK